MLKGYDEYQESQLPWVERIPAHWQWLRNGYLLKEHKDKVGEQFSKYTLLSLTTTGVKEKDINDTSGKVPESYEGYQKVNPGDMVFCLFDLDCSAVFSGLSNYNGMITSAYDVALPIDDYVNPRYLKYWFDSVFKGRYYEIFSKSVRYTINYDSFKTLKSPVPPRAEQDQIVRYLDWKVSEMNHFIHEKKKQIKKLEELKIAKVDELVTKGLNSEVKMKTSNVEWLGDIPVHWDIDHIKQHFTVKKRIAGKEGYDVLSITQQGLKVKDIASNEGQMAMDYSGYQFVYPGDFAMNHMDLITGYVDLSDKFGVTSPDYRVFSLDDTEHCYAPFYLRVFQIGYKRRIFYKFGKGAANQGRWRLPKTAFYDYSIQIPPIEEQMEIESACLQLEKDIDSMIDGIRKEIELVEELRVKTIVDVVTGQVDVRDVVIPEYTTEDEDFESDDIDDESEEADSDEE